MCVASSYAPPECITFQTVRRALAECESAGDRRGFHGEGVRIAYVVAQLRATNHPDCIKAAELLLQIVYPL